jgi:GTPase SAR1 family protein
MSSFKLKLLLIDLSTECDIGLVQKLSKNRFHANYKLTVGVNISTKDVEFRRNKIATLSIWDIGTQKRFQFIHHVFYKGATGAILIFDLNQDETYLNTRMWLKEIRQFAGPIPFLLIGINVSLLKLLDPNTIRDEARELALIEGGIYIETSPKSYYIVEEAIYELTKAIIDLGTQN